MLQDRCGCNERADLLEQDGDLDPTEAEPAEVGRHRDRRPALVDHRRPQLGIEPMAAVDHRAHMGRRRIPGEQLARRVAERDLVVAELEVHRGTVPDVRVSLGRDHLR